MDQLLNYLTPREKEQLKRSLKVLEIQNVKLIDFIEDFWPVVEPGAIFVRGRHINAISVHLEAVTRGEIRNLLINMPPRHMKSLLVSVFWPVWMWITKPHFKWLYASYGQALSLRDSLKCRRLIMHPLFQAKYGHIFHLTSDQRSKGRFDNNKLGYRIATSVDGIGTGEGGDGIVCDDPHNVKEAESEAVREGVLTWWDETMGSRLNDPKTGFRVIVMQRVHERDLSGHVLSKEGRYEHLCLPAEYEGCTRKTSIGWSDPRTEEGELLWPERFGREEIDILKSDLGIYGSAGQLQQRPSPREGGIIELGWFKERRYKTLPDFTFIWQSWDTAFKTKQENDFSVCTTWGYANGYIYLIDVKRVKLKYPELKKLMILNFKEYSPAAVLVEDKANGQSLIQEMEQPVADPDDEKIKYKLPIKGMPASDDPLVRVNAVTVVMQTKVCLPASAPWLEPFENELCAFPNGAHDDQVHSMVHALLFVSKASGLKTQKLDYFRR